MDHITTATLVCGEDVKVDLGTRGENEPAALSANCNIKTETIHVVWCVLIYHYTWGRPNIPTVFVVFVYVAEFNGKDNRTGIGNFLRHIVGVNSYTITNYTQVTVTIYSIAESYTDIEIPTLGNRPMVIKSNSYVAANTIIVIVFTVEATVCENRDRGISSEVGTASPSCVMFLTLTFLFCLFLLSLSLVLCLHLLTLNAVLLFLGSLFRFLLFFLAQSFLLFNSLFLGFLFGFLLFSLQFFLFFLLLFQQILLFFLLLFQESFLLFCTFDRVITLCESSAGR